MNRERLLDDLRAAIALAREGRYQAAREACDALLAVHPFLPPVLALKGRVCRLQGDLETAAGALTSAVETGPDLQEAWAEMARLKCAQRDPLGALGAWRRAVHLRPTDPDGWFNLGLAAEQAGELAEAASAYRRAMASGASGPAELGTRLATVLAASGEAEQALQVADAVLARWPEAAAALNARGQALVSLGRIGEARESLERAVELEPDLAEALQQLVETRRVRAEEDPDLVRLRAALERGPAEDAPRARLLYGLAKALDDLGRYDEAFTACRDANRLRAREGPRFDPAAMDRRVSAISHAFDPAPEGSVRAAVAEAPVPVFVLGLPRSGTTLVEQILAAHPDVATEGEHTWLERLAHGQVVPWPDAAARLSADEQARLSALARRHVREAAGDRGYVLNKYPGNVFFAGLARLLLPEARFLRVRRDARDTCLSIWFSDFGGINPYATDLAHAGAWYAGCHRLAELWTRQFDEAVVPVEYERLVAETEQETRRLLAALGLPWHPACLEFAASRRPVATLSAWQVRQPIHGRSVGRWRHYRRHLAPLLHALGELAPRD